VSEDRQAVDQALHAGDLPRGLIGPGLGFERRDDTREDDVAARARGDLQIDDRRLPRA